jgi:hypothetical protein
MDISKTNNILYNIINFEDPQQIFYYFIWLIIFLFVFTNIDFSITLFIGIIFFSILIYYFYTDRNKNYVDAEQKLNTKYETFSNDTNTIIKEYPDIVDYIFYLSTFKKYNPDTFDDIVKLFDNFIFLYNSINIDKSLADSLFKIMNNIKFNIINKIETFNFTTNNIVLSRQISKNKKSVEELLNRYLDIVLLIHKKNIYYNGYNNKSKIITTNNIIEYNFFDTNHEIGRKKNFNLFSEIL